MSFINYTTREINCKIVYYGPGLCGKTTNLRYIHKKIDSNYKGKLISLSTESERTLFFDFLPLAFGDIKGFKIRFHLYTVPGQIYYASSRKLILKGMDGIVFVADSQIERTEANIVSLDDLNMNLSEQGYNFEKIPLTIQYNKRDLSNIVSVEDMNRVLNHRDVQWFEAVAMNGTGVYGTFKSIINQVYSELKKRYYAD